MFLLSKLIIIKIIIVVLFLFIKVLVLFFFKHFILNFLRSFCLLTTFLRRRSFAVAVGMITITSTFSFLLFFCIKSLHSLNIVRLAELMVLSINNVSWLVGLCLISPVAADHISVIILVFARIIINLVLVLVLWGRLVVAHIFFCVSHGKS